MFGKKGSRRTCNHENNSIKFKIKKGFVMRVNDRGGKGGRRDLEAMRTVDVDTMQGGKNAAKD